MASQPSTCLCRGLVVVLAMQLCACATTPKHYVYRNKHTRYRIGHPGARWRRINARGADLAWLHKQDGSLLYTHSLCQSTDTSLLSLAHHLLIGMTDHKVLQRQTIQLSGRDALRVHMKGKLDGVPRNLQAVVLKKDGCVYDVVLVASPEQLQRHHAAFQAVLAPFDVASRAKEMKRQALK
ncbi:MAG: hypothetical protein AAF471_06480 [Myxococcota bacterium]